MKTCISILIVWVAIVQANAASISQQAYLKASNTGPDQMFGLSLAVSGDTVVVGAPAEESNAVGVNGSPGGQNAPNSGAAYVFVRQGTNWMQQAYLKASNTGAGDRFGTSVAVSGDTIVVGAPGEDSANSNQTDNTTGNAGAAYVFVRNGTNWSQQAYLKASHTDGGDQFGASVAASGDTIIITAPGDGNGGSFSGAAYVFIRTGTNWSQEAYLKASNPNAFDCFGGIIGARFVQSSSSVAISGDTAVIGAFQEDSNATGVNGNEGDNSAVNSGAAYVFVRTGTNWSQQAYLKASNTGSGDFFGFSVAISDNTIVIGAPFESSDATGVNGNQSDGAQDSGAAYVFVRNGTNWGQQAYLKASNTAAGDGFGRAVQVSSDLIIIGAHQEDSDATGVNGDQNNNNASVSGAAYIFLRNGTNWNQHVYLKASNTGDHDYFSQSLTISGDTIIAGAYGEKSSATGVNGDQSDNSLLNAGAAYIFTGLGGFIPQLCIARSASSVVLSWPTNATDYTLQSTTNLHVPALWSDSTNTPVRVGTNLTITVGASVAEQFFRLRM